MPEATSPLKDAGIPVNEAAAAAAATTAALNNLTTHRLPQLSAPEYEAVNHPAHYGGQDDPYEPIKVIEHFDLGFNTGNALKYLLRAGRKPGVSYAEDLQKAVWYLQREIDRAES